MPHPSIIRSAPALRFPALLLAMILIAAGCQTDSAPQAAADSGQPVPSKSLESAAWMMLVGAVREQERGGQKLADDVQEETFPRTVVDAMNAQYPSLMKATPAQEENFRRNKFDDQANAARIKALAAKAAAGKTPLPWMGRITLKSFQEGTLKGIYLEFGRRLLDAYDAAGMLGR